MVDSSRKQLADAVRELLPDNYLIYHYPRALDPIGADTDAVIIVERRRLEPTRPGSFDETFWLWIVVDRADPEAAEDQLDHALEEVQGALLQVSWCTTPVATREMYDEQRHAYRLELTTQSSN